MALFRVRFIAMRNNLLWGLGVATPNEAALVPGSGLPLPYLAIISYATNYIHPLHHRQGMGDLACVASPKRLSLFCIAFYITFCYTNSGEGILYMQFEWDDQKEKINIAKHGIDYSTAALVFGDENRIEKYDDAHSLDEDRYITIGCINGVPVIVMVVYTERPSVIRIISARLATNREKEAYYNAETY